LNEFSAVLEMWWATRLCKSRDRQRGGVKSIHRPNDSAVRVELCRHVDEGLGTLATSLQSPSARYTTFSTATHNSEFPLSRFLGCAATEEPCKCGTYIVTHTSREAWGYLYGGCFSRTSKESEYKLESFVIHRLNVEDILVHWSF
jgi:hypothetical protein